MKDLGSEAFDPRVSDEALLAIGRVTLSWCRLDGSLTQWLANESKGDFAVSYIQLGNVDVRGKLDKLSQLFKLTGEKAKRDLVTSLRERLVEPTNTRNLITHGLCLGTYKLDPKALGYLAFSKVRRSGKGKPLVPIGRVPIMHLVETSRTLDRFTVEITPHVPPSDEVPPSPLFGAPQ